MQTQIPAQQTQQNQSRTERKSPESAQPQFEDARPEATAQLRLQSLMANSAQTTQLKSMQAMMAANTPAKKLGQSPRAINPTPLQRIEDEEPLQAKTDEPVQREHTEVPAPDPTPQDAPSAESPKPNNTGLPDQLKTGIENLSGISMDHVKVHYNSDKPAQLQAHAYAQGSEIHVAPGQEQHLPHEAWHVVQQAQGRVRPTVQMKGGAQVNDDVGLEVEADLMGASALQGRGVGSLAVSPSGNITNPVAQRMVLPVWSKKKDKATFLDQGKQQSEKMSHGKVINMENWVFDKDLSGIEENEGLHIIGHGNPTSVAGMSPEQLVYAIVNRLKLPVSYKGQIYLEVCDSGTKNEQLEGSYAERFSSLLATARGEGSNPLSVTGFAGAVVLDTSFPKRETLRVLTKETTIEDFKNFSKVFVDMSQKIIDNFINELKEDDLFDLINPSEIQDLFFHIYNKKISKLAEPQGGSLTSLYVSGIEYPIESNAAPDINKIMGDIKRVAREEKTEIDNIQVLSLDSLLKEGAEI